MIVLWFPLANKILLCCRTVFTIALYHSTRFQLLVCATAQMFIIYHLIIQYIDITALLY